MPKIIAPIPWPSIPTVLSLWLPVYLFFQIIYAVGSHQAARLHSNELQQSILTRIALDIDELRVANPVLRIATSEVKVQRYLAQLNDHLLQQGSPVTVAAIQNVAWDKVPEVGSLSSRILASSIHNVVVQLHQKPLPLSRYFSFWALFLALPIAIFAAPYWQLLAGRQDTDLPLEEVETKPIQLVLDLKDRSLSLAADSPLATVYMSNKPFCFYAALLEYCQDNDAAVLHLNKNIPQELMDLAYKFFYRLLELGHTRRKRPDFSNNLDKMLSEVRAALDELFSDYPELKTVYFPPKAQGQGSRSKLHNYALPGLRKEHFQLLGK